MRLSPIDSPRGLLLKLVRWGSCRMFGTVIAPIRVVYAHFPEMTLPQMMMLGLTERLGLPPRLRFLVEAWVSTLNGCSFCADLHQAQGLASTQVTPEVFRALPHHTESVLFSEAERAALTYAEAVIEDRGQVTDEVFAALRAHFSEREVVELTWLVSFTQYLNMMALPLGLKSEGVCAAMHPHDAPKLLTPAHGDV
ncbi:MAG: carboxymuconolactone decarboxylase family protein [Myxococcota bacterium]